MRGEQRRVGKSAGQRCGAFVPGKRGQRRTGFHRVAMRHRHRPVHRVMRCKQRLRAFEVVLGEIGLAKRALPEGALLRIAVLPGQNGRQGDLLVGEIIAGVLSHLLGRGGVVQRVIHDLERHAELHPIDPHRLDLRRWRAGDLDAGRRRCRKQHRGLPPDHIEIILDRRVRLAGDGHLADLALGDPRGGGGKPS